MPASSRAPLRISPPPRAPEPMAVAQRRSNFLSELGIYVGRAREFERNDWLVYVSWVGLIFGLFFASLGFLLVGHAHGVAFPAEAWLLPAGALVFAVSIAIDTIGHRTIYKAEISRAEGLVHHMGAGAGAERALAALQPGRRGLSLAPLRTRVLRSRGDVEPRRDSERAFDVDAGLVVVVLRRLPRRERDAAVLALSEHGTRR